MSSLSLSLSFTLKFSSFASNNNNNNQTNHQLLIESQLISFWNIVVVCFLLLSNRCRVSNLNLKINLVWFIYAGKFSLSLFLSLS